MSQSDQQREKRVEEIRAAIERYLVGYLTGLGDFMKDSTVLSGASPTREDLDEAIGRVRRKLS